MDIQLTGKDKDGRTVLFSCSDISDFIEIDCAKEGVRYIDPATIAVVQIGDPRKVLLDEIQNHFANLKTEMTYSVRSSDGKERVEGFGLPGPAVKDAALAILEKVRASL